MAIKSNDKDPDLKKKKKENIFLHLCPFLDVTHK